MCIFIHKLLYRVGKMKNKILEIGIAPKRCLFFLSSPVYKCDYMYICTEYQELYQKTLRINNMLTNEGSEEEEEQNPRISTEKVIDGGVENSHGGDSSSKEDLGSQNTCSTQI